MFANIDSVIYSPEWYQAWFPRPSKEFVDPTKPLPLVFRGQMMCMLSPGENTEDFFPYENMWRFMMDCAFDSQSIARLWQLTHKVFGKYAFPRATSHECAIKRLIVHIPSKDVLEKAKALEGQWVTVTLRICGTFIFEALDIEIDPQPKRYKVSGAMGGRSCDVDVVVREDGYKSEDSHYWEGWRTWWMESYPACLETMYTKEKEQAADEAKDKKLVSVQPPSAPPLPPSLPVHGDTSHGDTSHGDTSFECVVCRDKQRTVVITPCRHFCICLSCTNAVSSCPICKGPKTSIIEVFVS